MASDATPKVFEDLYIQPRVRDFLVRAASSNQLSHAYLFLGPAGSGKLLAAKCLCEYLVCSNGGCGVCEDCRRASGSFEKNSNFFHMDVKVYTPASAVGYLVEQVRQIIEDVNLSAVKAKKKVYVITQADRLRGKGANALLKTIEEPPSDVIFILLATSVDSVLPTIVSRCQEVPFRSLPESVAEELVVKQSGCTNVEARVALSVTRSYEEAIEYLADGSRADIRQQVVYLLRDTLTSSTWQIIASTYKLYESVMDLSDAKEEKRLVDKYSDAKDVEEARKAEEEINKDFLSKKAQTELEKANKRDLNATQQLGIMEVLNTFECLLRDVLFVCETSQDKCVNEDVLDTIVYIASKTNTSGVIKAIEAVREAKSNVLHQITPQLTLEVMLINIKEALCL